MNEKYLQDVGLGGSSGSLQGVYREGSFIERSNQCDFDTESGGPM